jgi:hypothetical protein
MYGEELPFKVVRATTDEVLAHAANMIVGRAAYETAVRLFPRDTIHYRNGAQIIVTNQPNETDPPQCKSLAPPSKRVLVRQGDA